MNSCSYNGEIVQLQSALNDDYSNCSGKIKHVPHFRAHNWKIFQKPCACTFTSEHSFIDSFSSAKKRCNTSQVMHGASVFAQSCDRDRSLFPFNSEFLSLFFFVFLDFIATRRRLKAFTWDVLVHVRTILNGVEQLSSTWVSTICERETEMFSIGV